jgi:glutaconate CoA-transferase subunit A
MPDTKTAPDWNVSAQSANPGSEGGGMTEFLRLSEAIRKYVAPGCSLAAEGFTHLIPHAAGLEIIRQNIRHLILIRMTPDIIYDQLIGMGCADKLVFSWGGNPGVGSLHRLRDAYENEIPHRMVFEEHAHAAMANAFQAGAAGLPVAVFKGYRGTDYPKVNPKIRSITCPFTGEKLTAVPALRPDVAIIHAQRADREGNVWMRGIIGVQKEAVLASRHSIVTVEEIVDAVNENQGGTVIPRWAVDAVCEVPLAAFPSYAEGYYDRSNGFYVKWGEISRTMASFKEWMDEYVLGTGSYEEYLRKLKGNGYV